MSQSEQAVEVETAVTSYSMLGSRVSRFTFSLSSGSTRTQTDAFNPPPGTQVATIALQGFDLQYPDKSGENHFDFGKLQVSLSTSNTGASCTATLRDDRIDQRAWMGTVTGLVTFFGKAA